MKRKIVSHFMMLVIISFFITSCKAQHTLSKKQWLEDLASLETTIYEKHINPFWKTPKTVFDTAFASLRNKIMNTEESMLQPEIILTGFTKILALTADGHSGVSAKSRGELFGLYNYNVSWFPEGLFITRTDENNKSILGSKVIKIDDTPIEDVKKMIRFVSTSFHEQGFKRFSPRYLESPAVLFGLGVAKSPQQVTLTLQNGNSTIAVSFQRVSLKEQEKTKLITLNDIATYTLPLYRQNLGKYYWFEYLPDKKILYLSYLTMHSNKDESMEGFVKRLSQIVEKEDIEKFVVDMRLNGGGDQFTGWPLYDFIFSNPKINKQGKLFVITGHNTFSAATAFLEALETKTNCLIAGTAPCDSPMYPAEDNITELPNCKMEVRLSSEMWNYSLDDDNRNIIEPDIAVETNFKDYMQGIDPVLEAISNYKTNDKQTVNGISEKFSGRYLFGIDKTLEIKSDKGVFTAGIKGRLHTVLNPVTANRFQTGIKNLFFEFKDDKVILQYPDGKEKVLKKLLPEELTALDFVLNKQFDKAASVYEELKKNFQGNININGANLAALAFYLLIETKDFDMARALLQIAIKLDAHSEVAKNLAKALKNMEQH